MNTFIKIMYAALTLLVLLVTACSIESSDTKNNDSTVMSHEDLIKRGEYLVNTSGCDDCHSPKVFGPAGPSVDANLRLSGHPSNMPLGKVNKAELQNWVLFSHSSTAAVGPWGASFAGNITSDETGIGLWTEDQFINALRHGKFKGMEGARQLLPPMPWPVYGQMANQDLKAMFAYLKTTKPVRNIVPSAIPLNELEN